MIGYSEGCPSSVDIFAKHRDVFPLAHDAKTEGLQGLDHPTLWRVFWKAIHSDDRFPEVGLENR